MTRHDFDPDFVRYLLDCLSDGEPVQPPGLHHEWETGDSGQVADDGTSPWGTEGLMALAACCFYLLLDTGGGGEALLERLVSAALEVAAVEGQDLVGEFSPEDDHHVEVDR